ncbi:mitochondrial carrier protein [Niveomyces insectorum RCEF 264]|uniref:Mitochondrial carrier protein n=1 Tax=Niveomyces insectorum RCEF 264 TaxID=1081102 RepID=A0A167XUD7_9HYPO|nr:mitochondrial carrier protein [Niveomyces insectorum RCEF 264]
MSNGGATTGSKTPFHLLAGLGSGVLTAVLLQPIDLLKTRVQQAGHHSLRRVLADLRSTARGRAPSLGQGAIGAGGGGAGGAPRRAATAARVSTAPPPSTPPSPPARPTSFVASLYRGTVPSALRTGFGSALYFAGLNAIRSNAARVPFLSHGSSGSSSSSSSSSPGGSSGLVKLSNTGNMLAGAVARASAGFVLMPLTILKGLRGFFAGFGATAIRDAPYAGLYVLTYEQIKRRLNAWVGPPGPGGDSAVLAATAASAAAAAAGLPLTDTEAAAAAATATAVVPMKVSRAAAINFSSGVLAAAACSAVSNPFDAVKTRIQLQPARYHNMVHAARRMLAEEGVRSLWDGLALRMSRKAMSSALAWTVYEELIRRAETRWAAAAAAGGARHSSSSRDGERVL